MYTVGNDGSVSLVEEVASNLPIDELRARKRFWKDEIARRTC